jgi:ABC-2 type transport system permease protein
MVLMPIIIFPMMGAALNISSTAVEESLKGFSIAILNFDEGSQGDDLISFFNALNLTVVRSEAATIDEALASLQESNCTNLVVIPMDFTQNLTSDLQVELQVYSLFKSLSITEGTKASVASAPITAYENRIVYQLIDAAFPDKSPETVLDPVTLSSFVILKGNIIKASPEIIQALLMSQSFGFPLVIMLLLISAMQIAATSISIEKEEKTLETLLTLPVGRLSILTGKLAGSVVVAAAGAIAALIGVNYYTTTIFGFMPSVSPDLGGINLAMSPTSSILLGITMFVTIVSALALAICIAAFSENVRSAQSLVGPLNIVIVIPSIILMFADIEILPSFLQAILYAIPYTHSIIASKAALMGDYLIMLRSIAYISVFTIVILYIAARIFTTEKIITARLSLRKRARTK